ncbi:MAG: ATP-binding protein [Bacteroidetes bacterium]|nr:ATP-binding protein [Bacteroidota bacterium]
MGLHPKIQRRLMDVIRNVSRNDNKQFIMTSHSPTILDSVCLNSRIFIEKNNTGNYKAIQNISVNAALTKMDSKSFPLIDLYCEDNEAKKSYQKALKMYQKNMD